MQRLAEIEARVERLRPAVEAYRAALREWTRSARQISSRWRRAILATLSRSWARGRRRGEAARSDRRLSRALGEMRRELAPQEWARMQDDLGNALEALVRARDLRARIWSQAATPGGRGLRMRARRARPQDLARRFAATSVNLGDDLLALGEGEAAKIRTMAMIFCDAPRPPIARARAARTREPVDAAKIRIDLAYALGLLWNDARERELLTSPRHARRRHSPRSEGTSRATARRRRRTRARTEVATRPLRRGPRSTSITPLSSCSPGLAHIRASPSRAARRPGRRRSHSPIHAARRARRDSRCGYRR